MSKKRKSKKRGKRTKSQEEYDMRNPTRSFRVTKEVDEEIDLAKEKGLTLLDIVKMGLGLLKVKWRDEEQLIEEGRIIGYRQARERYGIAFPCEDCEHWAWVEKKEDRKLLTAVIRKSGGMTHVGCPNRKKAPDKQQMKTKDNGKQSLS